MEFEFDKEIDAILRKARENEAVFAANISEPHLDADVLSAFAENALPEKSKKLYTAHLADCDRCRRILSNLISLNAEEAIPVKIVETPVIETAIPWYRKLFFGRNLVFAMGALVIAFSAFTGYIVLKNMSSGLSSDISQANTASKSVRGPNADAEPVFSSNSAFPANANTASNMSAVSTNSTANAPASAMNAANTSATPAISGTTVANQSVAKSAETTRNKLDDDAVSGSEKPVDMPSQPLKEESRDLKNESERPKIALAEPKLDDREARKTLPAPPVAAAEKDEQQDKMVTRSTTNPSPAGAAKMAKKKLPVKTVNGKTFNYENSVWVDSQYRQGSPITNVSRGTEEYSKLDGGLKRIAEQFSETVVIVWKAKTYRIQ